MWKLSLFLLLALLSGAQASLVQMYGFFPIEFAFSVGYAPSMFLANSAFALCCLVWNRTLAMVFIVVQCALSAFFCTYVLVMGTQISLPTLINGLALVQQMDTGLLPYVSIKIIVIFLAIAGIMLVFRARLSPLSFKQRAIASLCAFGLFCTLHYANHNVKSYWILSPENTLQAMKTGNFSSIRESNARRGYLLSALIQVGTGALTTQTHVVETNCSPKKATTLPMASLGKRIVIIQIESLDWEVLNQKVGDNLVMPYLTELSSKGMLIKLDGEKKMGSSNSDYELFNAKEAHQQVLYYEHLTSYPDSLLLEASKAGYDLAVVHGITGQYMGLRSTYARMGVQKQYFTEELRQEGYSTFKPFGGIVLDADTFAYAGSVLPKLKTPAVLFLISTSMHEPHLIPPLPAFSGAGNEFYNACAHTDAALQALVQSAPADTTFIIYGDHTSYRGGRTGFVPMLIYTTDKEGAGYAHDASLTRCEMGHYLRRLFGFTPLQESSTQCPKTE